MSAFYTVLSEPEEWLVLSCWSTVCGFDWVGKFRVGNFLGWDCTGGDCLGGWYPGGQSPVMIVLKPNKNVTPNCFVQIYINRYGYKTSMLLYNIAKNTRFHSWSGTKRYQNHAKSFIIVSLYPLIFHRTPWKNRNNKNRINECSVKYEIIFPEENISEIIALRDR